MYDEQCSLTNYSSYFVVLLKNDEIVEKFVEVPKKNKLKDKIKKNLWCEILIMLPKCCYDWSKMYKCIYICKKKEVQTISTIKLQLTYFLLGKWLCFKNGLVEREHDELLWNIKWSLMKFPFTFKLWFWRNVSCPLFQCNKHTKQTCEVLSIQYISNKFHIPSS